MTEKGVANVQTPEGFLWGAATAAHQIEGGNVSSDFWRAERAPRSIFAEVSGDACDSYHRYREDVALLAAAGLNTYRFGVEWARIEPEEGWVSQAALDHYRRVAETCHEHGVAPMVTLHHFTSPAWFARRGGWTSDGAAERFAEHVARVASHLGDLVEWYCTINESNVLAVIQASGVAPLGTGTEGPSSGGRDDAPMAWVSADVGVMADAHRRAVDAIRSVSNRAHVGWTLALVDLQSVEGGEEQCARIRRETQLDWLAVSADDDFVGVQTYTRNVIGPDGLVPPPRERRMQTGWEVYPEALEHTVALAAATARVPVVVTENGMATDDDDARIAYTDDALRGVGRCLVDGIDVRGYLHWTLLDNFEWMAGYSKTFGLVEVDRTTFARRPKPSLAWLGALARQRSLPT